jgi:hypothetical protein
MKRKQKPRSPVRARTSCRTRSSVVRNRRRPGVVDTVRRGPLEGHRVDEPVAGLGCGGLVGADGVGVDHHEGVGLRLVSAGAGAQRWNGAAGEGEWGRGRLGGMELGAER